MNGIELPRVTAEMVEGAIAAVDHHLFPGTTMTVCAITLTNGYTVIGHSACVHPYNFSTRVGERLAFEDARSKVYDVLAFRMRDVLYGQAQMFKQVMTSAFPSGMEGM
jgi:hypothetical protein